MPSSDEIERGLASATIQDALARAGTTPARLAARSGVSRALVRDYLIGAKQPSVAQLARLVRSLGLEPVIELVPAYRPLTMAELGAQVSREKSESRRWRLLQEFLRGYGDAEPDERPGLVAEVPAPVDARWDALLGGVAEHLTFHDDRRAPAWALAGERFLDRWWFPGALDGGGRTWRMMTAPAALAARGVWLERAALGRASDAGPRASLPHLLAMKADAMRPQDAEDVHLLATAMGLSTAAEVAAVHDRLLPEEPLSERKLARIAEALAVRHEP